MRQIAKYIKRINELEKEKKGVEAQLTKSQLDLERARATVKDLDSPQTQNYTASCCQLLSNYSLSCHFFLSQYAAACPPAAASHTVLQLLNARSHSPLDPKEGRPLVCSNSKCLSRYRAMMPCLSPLGLQHFNSSTTQATCKFDWVWRLSLMGFAKTTVRSS